MKKWMKALVATAMAACILCTSALAAPSKTEVVEVDSAVDAAGNAVTVDILKPTQKIESSTAKDILKAEKPLTSAAAFKIDVPAGTKFPLKLSFNVSGVKKGQKVYAMLWNGSEWEKVEVTVDENGVVTGEFASAGDVTLFVENEEAGENPEISDKPSTDKPSTDKPSTDKPSTNKPSNGNTTATSPNTGAGSMNGIALVVMLAAATTAVAVMKKKAE